MIGRVKASMLAVMLCATEVLTRLHAESKLISDGERNSIISLTDSKADAEKKSGKSESGKKDSSKKDGSSKSSSLAEKPSKSDTEDSKDKEANGKGKEKEKSSSSSSSSAKKNSLVEASASPADSYLADPSSKLTEANSELADSKKSEEKDPKKGAATEDKKSASKADSNKKSKLIDSMDRELPESILKASRLIENPPINDSKSNLIGSDSIFDYVKENSGKLDSLSGLVDTVITNRNSDKAMKGSFGKDSTALV